LEVLARQQITATFFHLGEHVERWPQGVRAVAALGHQVAVHGYRHRPFPLEAPAALRGQLAYTRQLLASLSGRDVTAIRDVRPPYGLYTPSTLAALAAWGYRAVMWSVVPFHWVQPAHPTIDQTTSLMRSGSVLVLHEGLGGPPVAQLTDVIVTRLKAAGYQFVNVEQMWQSHCTTATGDA
jgi:peptidoglycan/xylan/chitin deacetylase (PgdA/CDA1 family)